MHEQVINMLCHMLFVLLSHCSRYVAFAQLVHLNDLIGDVTFTLLTNQRPTKCDRIKRKKKVSLVAVIAL